MKPKIKVLTKKLVEIRIRKGLNQTELADIAGITSGYVSQIENELYTPSPKVAHKIAEALSVDFDEIFLIIEARNIKDTRNIEASA